MPALNVCLQVANIAEASGVPYVEKLAKVAVAVFELLEVRTQSSSISISYLGPPVEKGKKQERCKGAL